MYIKGWKAETPDKLCKVRSNHVPARRTVVLYGGDSFRESAMSAPNTARRNGERRSAQATCAAIKPVAARALLVGATTPDVSRTSGARARKVEVRVVPYLSSGCDKRIALIFVDDGSMKRDTFSRRDH